MLSDKQKCLMGVWRTCEDNEVRWQLGGKGSPAEKKKSDAQRVHWLLAAGRLDWGIGELEKTARVRWQIGAKRISS